MPSITLVTASVIPVDEVDDDLVGIAQERVSQTPLVLRLGSKPDSHARTSSTELDVSRSSRRMASLAHRLLTTQELLRLIIILAAVGDLHPFAVIRPVGVTVARRTHGQAASKLVCSRSSTPAGAGHTSMNVVVHASGPNSIHERTLDSSRSLGASVRCGHTVSEQATPRSDAKLQPSTSIQPRVSTRKD